MNKYHTARYEQENGKTVWFVENEIGELATGEMYTTELDAKCEIIQLEQAQRDIDFIEKKTRNGSSKISS